MKSFRYENLPTFRVISEADIQKEIDSGRLDERQLANTRQILALDMDESFTTESGSTFTRVADDSEPVSAIFCGGRRTARRCEFCRLYVRGNGLLCDGPPTKKGAKTCDAFMCRKCAKNIGPDRDLCPRCVKATKPEVRA